MEVCASAVGLKYMHACVGAKIRARENCYARVGTSMPVPYERTST
jgi:hypothetical protein